MNNTIETYQADNQYLIRNIKRRDGTVTKSQLERPSSEIAGTAEDYDLTWLRSKQIPSINQVQKSLKLVDLFCGTGPMTLGIIEAGRALEIEIKPVYAIDFEESAAKNYKLNFPECEVINNDITKIIDGELGTPLTDSESILKQHLGNIDIVIGGPPCQGHSDLNNHTRRDDPRNALIKRVVRFVEIFKPEYVIIENVQGIRHDKHNVLGEAEQFLQQLGYHLKENLLLASSFGVAQNRRRFLLVATKKDISIDTSQYERRLQTTTTWAIEDLMDIKSTDIYNTSAQHSEKNQSRIEYLFKHNLYELPNELRPKCQQKANNRYTSVYGRMYPDKPAPTITGGFGSIGQGRFAHPYKKRTLTPHEAARIQFIPDFFQFDNSLTRVALQKMIGNAVPPKLTYILGLEILR